jgi:hypothetical protein
MTFIGVGLWGTLARQLIPAVVGADRLEFCSGCGELFEPQRKRHAGKQAWCNRLECKQKARASATRRFRLRTKITPAISEDSA